MSEDQWSYVVCKKKQEDGRFACQALFSLIIEVVALKSGRPPSWSLSIVSSWSADHDLIWISHRFESSFSRLTGSKAACCASLCFVLFVSLCNGMINYTPLPAGAWDLFVSWIRDPACYPLSSLFAIFLSHLSVNFGCRFSFSCLFTDHQIA